MSTNLNTNAVFQRENEPIQRLLWQSSDGKQCACIPVEGAHWPLVCNMKELEQAMATGKAVEVPDTLVQDHCPDDALTAAQRRKRAEAWEQVSGLVKHPDIFDPVRRGELVEAAAKANGVHAITVRKHLRRYWQRGQTMDALQPDYRRCGAPGTARTVGTVKLGRPSAVAIKGNNGSGGSDTDSGVANVGLVLTEADHKAMNAVIEKHYRSERRFPFKRVYGMLLAAYYINGYETAANGVAEPQLKPVAERPTFAQFRYFFEKHHRKDTSLRDRVGEVNFGRNHRGLLGVQSQMATGPGDLYMIDATTADVNLVHSGRPSMVVGRPILYMVVDAFSGLVAGLHVTFGGASYSAAGMALWNAYCDKAEFCRSLNIPLTPEHWPSRGLPHTLLADRGEMLGKATNQLVERLGINITNTAPYRADAKGLVERHFRLRNEEVIKWLPGAVPDEHAVGAAKNNYRKKSSLTREEFTAALVHAIIAHNVCVRAPGHYRAEVIRDDVEQRPYKLWAWGRPRLKTLDQAAVRVCLLPPVEGTVTDRGIRVNGALYTCRTEQAENWRSRARTKVWQVPCVHDPSLVDCVYLLGKRAGDMELCQLDLVDQRFAGWTFGELEAYQRSEREALAAARNDDYQTKATATARIESIVAGAEARKEELGDTSLAAVTVERLDQRVRDNQLEAKKTMQMTGAASPASSPTPLPVPAKPYKLGEKQASQWRHLIKKPAASAVPLTENAGSEPTEQS